MRYSVIVLTAFIICTAFAAKNSYKKKDFDKMKRLTGTWKTYNDAGTQYERWTLVDGDEIAVKSYKMNNRDTVVLEDVKLSLDSGSIYYTPTVYGQNNDQPIKFAMTSCRRRQFVFENAGHDFPQKITYELITADSLNARVEGMLRGKLRKANFYYVRMK